MHINLKVFAEHSHKIPSSFLAPKTKSKRDEGIAFHKIFSAYAIDLMIVMSLVYYCSFFVSMGVRAFLPHALAGFDKDIVFYEATPLIILSYYSLADFFNGGQSYGMYKLDFRTPVHSKSYWETFTWSLYSSCMAMSLGLFGLFTKNKRKEFKTNDYLYHEFISYKEHSPIHLLQEIEQWDSFHEQEVEEEIFLDVA